MDRAPATGRVSRASNGTLRLRAPEATPQCMNNCGLSSYNTVVGLNETILTSFHFIFVIFNSTVGLTLLPSGIAVVVEAAEECFSTAAVRLRAVLLLRIPITVPQTESVTALEVAAELIITVVQQHPELVRRVLCTSSGIEAQ